MDLPAPTGQEAPVPVHPMEIVLGSSVQPQARPRQSPLKPTVKEVEEIQWEPMNAAPQVFQIVVRCGDEFEMLEEDVDRAEVKALRADLTMMMRCIEVS